MRFRSVFSQIRTSSPRLRRSYSNLQPQPERPAFGIAFDIDGVLLRGHNPIGGSPQALKRLYNDDGSLKIPFLFLTNGGGVPESKRAFELSGLLGIPISPLQVVQGHSPFRKLASRFENGLVIAVGKGEPAAVMSEYGFKKVLSIDEYTSYFKDIDPLSQYKTWKIKQTYDKDNTSQELHPSYNIYPERVEGAFVVSDPIDWGRDIQVLCDILTTGGFPGKDKGYQPPLYFASDDLEYQGAFPSKRLGMGAFRIALESIFNSIHSSPLEYTSFGKPNPFVFQNAEKILAQLSSGVFHNRRSTSGSFSTIYMVGDNPLVDIKGAMKAGHPWFSILTRTGVFKGEDNHQEFPADLNLSQTRGAGRRIVNSEIESIPLVESRNARRPSSSTIAGGLPPLGRPVSASQSSERRAGSSMSNYRKEDYNWRYDNEDISEDVIRTSNALENIQLDRKARNLTSSWRHVNDGIVEDDGKADH